MNLDLFSTPGQDDTHYVLDASRSYLEGKRDPIIVYIPAGSLDNRWHEYTVEAFRGLGRVETLDTEMMTLPEMETLLRCAAQVYIPGGNTYLLSHRLQLCKIIDPLRRKVVAGLPVVAFSAGTVLCGPNILTSNNLNIVPTTYFKGLAAVPFNFNVHYPADPLARATRDEWLSEYHTFHDNPVLLLSDGAYVRVSGKKATLVRGPAWILRKGYAKQELEEGKTIPV
ncbi:MAG: Type 1 glutamine amidotransferase-like domain-containing protein [Anaerolineales bacterium]|nr:Type 1 glutamine amidotransferase-like domain-containing protein [Anaerolineales bacterium]